MWIDVASTCNLKCRLCYTTAMQGRDVMAPDLFAHVLDRALSASVMLRKLHLNWRGEPLANRRLQELLAHAYKRAPTLEIEWHTNGTLIRPRLAEEIIDANPNQTIFVSIDGGTKAVFEQARGQGMWERALTGLESLLTARGRRSQPQICVYQLDLGVPTSRYDRDFREMIARVDRHIVVLPVNEDGSLTATAEMPRGPCFWLGSTLAVDCHGAAYTCLLRSGTRLGSLLDEDVDELLRRAAMLRRAVEQRGRVAVQGCTHCRKPEGAPTESERL
jgi:sulfatase maturation enzyme AslB (radical SAM superfamily)